MGRIIGKSSAEVPACGFPQSNVNSVALHLNRRLWQFTALNSVLTQLWCTCGSLAGIDDKSVISRKPLLRSEQRDASPRIQDGPGLDHGSSRSELCRLSWLPIHLALAP